VIAAVGLGGILLVIAAGLIWTARLVHIGNLDALGWCADRASVSPTRRGGLTELRRRQSLVAALAGMTARGRVRRLRRSGRSAWAMVVPAPAAARR
jgi:hypothetical protein